MVAAAVAAAWVVGEVVEAEATVATKATAVEVVLVMVAAARAAAEDKVRAAAAVMIRVQHGCPPPLEPLLGSTGWSTATGPERLT